MQAIDNTAFVLFAGQVRDKLKKVIAEFQETGQLF
jgi:hypothetical protein